MALLALQQQRMRQQQLQWQGSGQGQAPSGAGQPSHINAAHYNSMVAHELLQGKGSGQGLDAAPASGSGQQWGSWAAGPSMPGLLGAAPGAAGLPAPLNADVSMLSADLHMGSLTSAATGPAAADEQRAGFEALQPVLREGSYYAHGRLIPTPADSLHAPSQKQGQGQWSDPLDDMLVSSLLEDWPEEEQQQLELQLRQQQQQPSTAGGQVQAPAIMAASEALVLGQRDSVYRAHQEFATLCIKLKVRPEPRAPSRAHGRRGRLASTSHRELRRAQQGSLGQPPPCGCIRSPVALPPPQRAERSLVHIAHCRTRGRRSCPCMCSSRSASLSSRTASWCRWA